jgi:hypothetical protein
MSKRKRGGGEAEFKVVLVGDSGAGKSCLLSRYLKGQFTAEHQVTIGTFPSTQVPLSEARRLVLIQADRGRRELPRAVADLGHSGAVDVQVDRQILLPQLCRHPAGLQPRQVTLRLSRLKSFEHLEEWLR